MGTPDVEPEEPLYTLEPAVLGAAPNLSFMSLGIVGFRV